MPNIMINDEKSTLNTLSDDYQNPYTDGWPDPTPLDEMTVPAFPVETLPGPGRIMVEHVAQLIQCDTALPAAALLGIYALSIQRRTTVSVDSLKEETALWIVPVADVSERKSTSFSAMLKPVYTFDAEERNRMKSVAAESIARKKIIESQINNIQKKVSGDEVEEKINEMTRLQYEFDNIPVINPPRLMCDNITEEVVSKLMKENGERIAIVSDEPTLFQQMNGQRDRKTVLDVFIKGYTGDPLQIDRLSRSSILINRPQLTVIVAAQPGALREFMNVIRFVDRGVLSRFMFFPCKSYAGTREWKSGNWDSDITKIYYEHIRTILANSSERNLSLSSDARTQFIKHHDDIEARQAPGAEFDQNSWAGKQPGRTLRIAAGMHCAENPQDNTINVSVIERAIQISEYSMNATLYVNGLVQEPDEIRKLRKLLNRMIAQKKPIQFMRDIHRSIRRQFSGRTYETRRFINKLAELGHVRKIGNARSEAYMLHPMYQNQAKMVTE